MILTTKHGTIEATISPVTKAVMVAVSGGMDSAVLLYMLCKQIRDNNLGIPVYTGTASYNSDRVATFHASMVVKHMRKEFPDITIHPMYWTGEGNVGEIKPLLVETMYSDIRLKNGWTKHQFKLWWGVTGNPSDDSFKFVEPEGHYVVPREPNHSPAKVRYGLGFANPFARIDKRLIVAAQIEYGLFECYTSITNSCTSLTEYQCNKCWWCQERDWAIEQVVPKELVAPKDTAPMSHYDKLGIDKKWKAGVRWNKEAYLERLKMEEEHLSASDKLVWAKRFLEGMAKDCGTLDTGKFKLGVRYMEYSIKEDRYYISAGKGEERIGPLPTIRDCWPMFDDVEIVDCANEIQLMLETGVNPGETLPPPA